MQVVYLVRRACRVGFARRADLLRYFPASPATYTRWITQSLDVAPCLDREGEGRAARIVRKTARIPEWASYEALLYELESGNNPRITGLEDSELPVFVARWTRNMPVDPTALGKIMQAIIGEQPIRLRYVGLRRGESAHLRCIYPVGLERMGDQWRLIGCDLEKPGYPFRVFVLARILGVEGLCDVPKIGFVRPGIEDRETKIKALFNPALTSDQAIAIANELRVQDGQITLNDRSQFEFFRRFGAQDLSAEAVWPLLHNRVEDKEQEE
ncbi:WYL domain-containing protein [Thermithiobacillus tepidarius DSM 3134]|uniref:WYL domain-containing protein n=1 Tax=Thermithiobacillus tepidarius TaxID=929 RepID=UPI00056FDA2D|nr:WYL domain-containing protein [Thermithiobacillus tepidarius]